MKKLKAPNFTATPNTFYDEWIPAFESWAEHKVVEIVIRNTFGWHRKRAKLTIDDIQAQANLARASAVDGVQRALEHGFIGREKIEGDYHYFVEVEIDNEASSESELSPEVQHPNRPGSEARPSGSSESEPPIRRKKPEGKKPGNKGSVSAASKSADETITKAWDFWQKFFCDCFDTHNYTLTKKIKGQMRARIFGELRFTLADFEQACRGLRLSKHHMGGNKDGVFYLQPKYVWGDDDRMQENIARYRESLKQVAPTQATPSPSGPRRVCDQCNDTDELRVAATVPDGLTTVPTQFWSKLLTDLSKSLGAGTVGTWFSKLKCAGVDSQKVYIHTPSPDVRDWITKHHAAAFSKEIETSFGRKFEIEWLLPTITKCNHESRKAA
jgi:hypothetical protein